MNIEDLLDRLEARKLAFGTVAADEILRLLDIVEQTVLFDAPSLVRLHEALLFVRAYPQSRTVMARSERMLRAFAGRVASLRESSAELDALDPPEVSGIAGTAVNALFSYEIVRWLVRRHAPQISIDWDDYEHEARLAETLPRFLPLLADDSLVEAHVPVHDWLEAARPRGRHELPWLIDRFESLPVSEAEKQELYSSLKLAVRWKPRLHASTRTGNRLPRSWSGKAFFHTEPLLQRRDVSLQRELSGERFALQKLAPDDGMRFLDLARTTSLVRYRELHGFTYGDPRHVYCCEFGRGVCMYLNGVAPDRRLPLRAYHSGMMFKNGVPIGYVEGLSFFERMEIGFNLYYTFREGETAWLYARMLKLFRQVLGIRCVSVDPYQLGHGNDEGLESGAFWFYRKLGFRPTDPRVRDLMVREERKISAKPGYRTPPATLRKLVVGSMLYEVDSAVSGSWDRFQVRNLGLAVQRNIASCFGGDAAAAQESSASSVAPGIGLDRTALSRGERQALDNLALVAALVPGLERWAKEERTLLAQIIRAKGLREESAYLRLMQRHESLRRAWIEIGSR
ncbi:MAG TPA: hypothetical protein VEZ11_08345 [Thermoanaerobaculia bacterium]|nr:hypothetical protein [Thermoanaerobaculia bacterium]